MRYDVLKLKLSGNSNNTFTWGREEVLIQSKKCHILFECPYSRIFSHPYERADAFQLKYFMALDDGFVAVLISRFKNKIKFIYSTGKAVTINMTCDLRWKVVSKLWSILKYHQLRFY